MPVTEIELALRKSLIIVTAERDRFARTCMEMKEATANHERVHALCASALNDLGAKNQALEALARQLKSGLQQMVKAYDSAAGFQKLRSGMTELAPHEVPLKQMYDEALAACAKLGIQDLPGEPA